MPQLHRLEQVVAQVNLAGRACHGICPSYCPKRKMRRPPPMGFDSIGRTPYARIFRFVGPHMGASYARPVTSPVSWRTKWVKVALHDPSRRKAVACCATSSSMLPNCRAIAPSSRARSVGGGRVWRGHRPFPGRRAHGRNVHRALPPSDLDKARLDLCLCRKLNLRILMV